jgi:hypothetical protein
LTRQGVYAILVGQSREYPTVIEAFLQISFQNVRSSKRTDFLHSLVVEEVVNLNPHLSGYTWTHEVRVNKDGFGGTFDVDIVGVCGDKKVAILAKALNSNINKNIKNYANTTVGEASRLMFAESDHFDEVFFYSIHPRKAPMFKSNGDVSGYDDVVSAKKRTNIRNVLQQQYDGRVKVIDLWYDIEDIDSMSTKSDFLDISVSNLTYEH